MVRKMIILSLTLVTIGSAALWIDGVRNPGAWPLKNTSESSRRFEYWRQGGSVCISVLAPRKIAPKKMPAFKFAGFGYHSLIELTESGPQFRRTLLLPLWSLIVLFGTYPTYALIRGPIRRLRRKKQGLCIHCGYNLKGSVGSCCPECGTSVED